MRSALLVFVLLASIGQAAALECRDALVAAGARHTQATMKAIAACRGRDVPDCGTDVRTTARLARVDARLRAAVAQRCCGTDHVCGTGDDEALTAIGWGAGYCPNLDRGDCNQLVRHPGDAATCIACVGRGAAEGLADFLAVPSSANGPAPRCATTTMREGARLLIVTSKNVARCWAARSAGAHANPCPDPGDGTAGSAIAAAIARATAALCKACGGADAACDGAADVDPAALGFPPSCPDVAVPGGAVCGAPITTAGDLVACVTCLTEHLARCADRVAASAFVAYPAECADPAGSCTAGVECASGADCPVGFQCLDNGSGTTRYCIGPGCTAADDCGGGSVCRQYCTFAGCAGGLRCMCPGFSCAASEVCIDDGGLACRRICTQDSDCPPPLGVCINYTFGAGLCISSTPCQ